MNDDGRYKIHKERTVAAADSLKDAACRLYSTPGYQSVPKVKNYRRFSSVLTNQTVAKTWMILYPILKQRDHAC